MTSAYWTIGSCDTGTHSPTSPVPFSLTWQRINRGRFVVTAGREPCEELLSLPAFKVDQILIFGSCLITPAALRHCLKNAIPITLLSSRGTYYGKLESPIVYPMLRFRHRATGECAFMAAGQWQVASGMWEKGHPLRTPNSTYRVNASCS